MPSNKLVPLTLADQVGLLIGILTIVISLPFALTKAYLSNADWPLKRTIAVSILRLRIKIQPYTRKAFDPPTGEGLKAFCAKKSIAVLGSTDIDCGPSFPECTLHEVQVPGASKASSVRHLVYFHGGAYLSALAPIAHIPWALELAKAASCSSIFFLEYSLAPEVPYPAQTVQAAWAMRHLLRQRGLSPGQIILAGDSAGGHLALSLLAHCSQPHPQAPNLSQLVGKGNEFRAAAVFSPVVDCSTTWRSFKENDSRDFVTSSTMTRIKRGWRPKEDEVWANVSIEPKPGFWRQNIPVRDVLVTVGEWEVLRDEGIKMSELLGAGAGNEERKLIVGAKEVHVQQFPDIVTRTPLQPGGSRSPVLAWLSRL